VGGALYIAGTGSFAAELIDIAGAASFEVTGLLELADDSRVGREIHGLPVLAIDDAPNPGAAAVIAVGGDRREAGKRLDAAGWDAVTVIHPAAHVSGTAQLEAGAVVFPGAVIGAHARIGRHALVSRGALVGHHVTIGDYATVGPGANIAGWSEVGTGGHLAMGSIVVNGKRVGSGSLVAAGAVVTADVDHDERVQGVPARPYRGH
jgi:sugar O-acyltransferase (sialic acid O-acetyltransferase NeuD family)